MNANNDRNDFFLVCHANTCVCVSVQFVSLRRRREKNCINEQIQLLPSTLVYFEWNLLLSLSSFSSSFSLSLCRHSFFFDVLFFWHFIQSIVSFFLLLLLSSPFFLHFQLLKCLSLNKMRIKILSWPPFLFCFSFICNTKFKSYATWSVTNHGQCFNKKKNETKRYSHMCLCIQNRWQFNFDTKHIFRCEIEFHFANQSLRTDKLIRGICIQVFLIKQSKMIEMYNVCFLSDWVLSSLQRK